LDGGRAASERRRPWIGGGQVSIAEFVGGLSPPPSRSRAVLDEAEAQQPRPGYRAGAVSDMITGDRAGIGHFALEPLHPALVSIQGGRRERWDSGGPVDVAAAGLAGDQQDCARSILQALGRDRHETGAAEVGLVTGQGIRSGEEDPVVAARMFAGSWWPAPCARSSTTAGRPQSPRSLFP